MSNANHANGLNVLKNMSDQVVFSVLN